MPQRVNTGALAMITACAGKTYVLKAIVAPMSAGNDMLDGGVA